MNTEARQLSSTAGDFHMPAEWQPHEATWIGWPHNQDDWPGKLDAVVWAYGEIVRHLVPGEVVRILVSDAAHEASARRVLQQVDVDLVRTEFFRIPTNRGWARDFGPIGVRHDETGDVAIAQFRFNAWAKYENWQLDDAVPAQLAARLNLPLRPVVHRGRGVVLEGGAIDVNGNGTLLTTEECLLDPNVQVRNPGFTRNDYDAVFRESLGVTNVVWLGQGIAGDDTHGHVDDLCRFANRSTVVLAQESNPADVNYRPLQENLERLQSARLEDGSKLDIVPLPMPQPLLFDGIRLPASYANFYIANGAVLVPTFNDPHDRIALGILGELFTDRPVIGVHAVDLVWGLGTLHCLTQQHPSPG